jgi:hypothetical protein
MKRDILIGFMAVLIVMSASFVLADGAYFSNFYKHMSEPSQKAVILWNGTTETMVLSSALRSERLANFVWIVPIQSSTNPVIEASNMSVFSDLIGFFMPPRNPSLLGLKETAGIEVIGIQKIDVYDIAILKATNANELINWLNENGYGVPEEAAGILQEYCDKNNFYFIANKINLENKYAEQLTLIKNVYPNFLDLNRSEQEKRIFALSAWDSADEVICNVPYEDTFASKFLSKEDYNVLILQYNWADIKEYWECTKNEYSWNSHYKPEIQKLVGTLEFYQLGIGDKISARRDEIYNNIKDKANWSSPWDIETALGQLGEGSATPLKFEFTPEVPFYPLKISSIGEGETTIEVYIISQNPANDENNILKTEESKKITPELKDKLGKQLNIGDSQYATRLSYTGSLKSLNADALFAKETFEIKNMTYGQCVMAEAKIKNQCYASSAKDKSLKAQCKTAFKAAKEECKKIKHNFLETAIYSFY